MNEVTSHVKLLAKKEGNYIVYVFKNLTNNSYIMCTKLPNWQVPDINIGDIGFLTTQLILAGEKYFDRTSNTSMFYRFSNIYFINFINEQKILNNQIEL